MQKTLLGISDAFELEPFTYPWAWDMSKDCEANTWSPEEIPVSGDVSDYKNPEVPELYKYIFEGVLAQLTTFDILRGDDAAETFLQIFTPAEIKHFFKRLIWEEALHTRSYRYIIENLGVPLEIYKRHETVPIMRRRGQFADQMSLPIRRILCNPPAFYDPQQVQDIYRSLVWWFLIFEGVWFWMNLLGPVQALGRMGYFRGAAEQFVYIARDEQQHISFGVKLIKQFQKEYAAILPTNTMEIIHKDIHDSIELELEYVTYYMKGKSILGYNIKDHIETAKYFANLRLKSINQQPLYPDAKHQYPWFSEVMELKKETNFFEKRVTEYQTGGTLTFDDTDGGFESVLPM